MRANRASGHLTIPVRKLHLTYQKTVVQSFFDDLRLGMARDTQGENCCYGSNL